MIFVSETDPANPDFQSVKVQGTDLPTVQDVLDVISNQSMPLMVGQTPDNLVKATAPGLVVDAGVAVATVFDATSHAKLPTAKAVADYITSIQNTFKYVKEWHVSPTQGNNSNVGSEDAPFATIAYALTKIDGSGHALILHVGTYTEAVTLNLQYNFDIVGAANKSGLVNLTGLWTFAGALSTASVRATKVNFAGGIALSGVTGLYLADAQCASINKTGAGYLEAVDADINGVVSLTGAGMALYVSSTVTGMVINNANAVGVTRDCKTVGPVVVTAGVYQDDNSTNYASTLTGYAVSSTVNGAVYMQRGACLTPSSTVARVQLLGLWSISNMAFDEANSILTGTHVSTYSYFDSIKTFGADGLVASNTARTRTAKVTHMGLDLPSYTATEIANLTGVPVGRMLWNSTDSKPQYWTGATWVQLRAAPTVPVMTGATSNTAGAAGLVPAPGAGDQAKVLTGAGTYVAQPVVPGAMTGATSSTAGAAGLVPAPAAGDQDRFLAGDGTFKIPAIAAGSIGSTELASTAVTPGTYGDATKAVTLTVDQDGRITAASETAITSTGTVAVKQYAKFTCAPQTSQPISVGYRIVFNQTEARSGTDITLTNGGNQININPTVPGTQYKVRSSHGIAYASAGPALVQTSLLEIASQHYVGSKSITTATNKANNIAYNADGAEYTITANALIAITLLITYNEHGTVLGYDASQGTDQQPWIEIEAVTAPFVVPNSGLVQPTTTILRAGQSGNYTPPTGCVRIEFEAVAPGASGSGGGSNIGGSVSNAGPSGDLIFGGLTLKGGPVAYANNPAPTLPAGWEGYTLGGSGGRFGGWTSPSSTVPANGGQGASSPFGDGGGGGTSGYGAQSPSAPGAGGGGGGTYGVINQQCYGGLSGGSGDYAKVTIKNPVGPFAYSLGYSGTPGGPGTSGNGGESGSHSFMAIKEFY